MKSSFDFELLHSETPSKAILLFHGLTGSPFEMKKYGTFLHKSGYDVYCYCLPGHGDYPQHIQSVSCKDWIDFSQEKYTKLRSKYSEFFLSGLCLGAVIALNLAAINDDVTGVISLSTTLYLDGWTVPWYNFLMPLGLNTLIRYYYTFPEREPYGIKNVAIRNKIASLMSRNTVAMDNYPLSCIYELLQLSKQTRKIIKEVACPILIIHSLEDDLTSIKSAKFVFDNVASKNKEYLELKDSYHLVLYDNEREFVFNKTLDFLEKLSVKELCEATA